MSSSTYDRFMDYFGSSNLSLTRRIASETRQIASEHGDRWTAMSPVERDALLNEHFMGKGNEESESGSRKWTSLFPRLKLSSGEEVVHYKDGDVSITYKDEFSGDFSWETKSQTALSLANLGERGRFESTPPPPPKPKRDKGPRRSRRRTKNDDGGGGDDRPASRASEISRDSVSDDKERGVSSEPNEIPRSASVASRLEELLAAAAASGQRRGSAPMATIPDNETTTTMTTTATAALTSSPPEVDEDNEKKKIMESKEKEEEEKEEVQDPLVAKQSNGSAASAEKSDAKATGFGFLDNW